ncbi:hypothetical protein MKEN_00134400 [Mycena kentingensis (nom. inval.)]|nr:hypothetical protein MKEN_00134400 [Mycena kentingensis (nom. inval.)]
MLPWAIPSSVVLWLIFGLFRELRRRRQKRAIIHFEDLPEDVLQLVVAQLARRHLEHLAGLSRTLRRKLSPVLFRAVRWAPLRRSFPPETLWPYVQRLTLAGDYPVSAHTLLSPTELDRGNIIEQLSAALPHLSALQTFTISALVKGSLWPELLEALAAHPTPRHLIMEAAWDEHSVILPETRTSLEVFEYSGSMALYATGYNRRSSRDFEVEATNLRRILSGCYSTLKATSLPGELCLRAMDTSLDWATLQELHLEGFWPYALAPRASSEARSSSSESAEETASVELVRSPVLGLIEALPNLEHLRLLMSVVSDDAPGLTMLVGPHQHTPRNPETFLRRLRIIELASHLANDRFLAFLPSTLDVLTLARYPLATQGNMSRPILAAPDLLESLHGVDFPTLRSLTVWYRVRSLEQADADDEIFSLIPAKFPLLETLWIWRFWDHKVTEMEDLWDPVPKCRRMLSRLPQLRHFRLNPATPERHGRPAFNNMDVTYRTHVKRLERMAEEIVRDHPSLRHIALYRPYQNNVLFHWEHWEVQRSDEDEVRLKPIDYQVDF